MPRYIVRLNDGTRDWWLEWSTVVDAPVTHGMSLDEFRAYYREANGERGMAGLQERIDRALANGSSSQMGDTVEDLISCNRAGPKESRSTLAEIIHDYCHTRAPHTVSPAELEGAALTAVAKTFGGAGSP